MLTTFIQNFMALFQLWMVHCERVGQKYGIFEGVVFLQKTFLIRIALSVQPKACSNKTLTFIADLEHEGWGLKTEIEIYSTMQ